MADEREERGEREPNETVPLVSPIRQDQDRQPQNVGGCSECSGLLFPFFKVVCSLLGLWGHQKWNCIPRALFFMFGLTQAVCQISADCGCPCFDCNYNTTQIHFLHTRETCFTIFSVAACLSYSVFIACLIAYGSEDSVRMSPSKSKLDVEGRKEITWLFFLFIIIMALFLSGMVLLFIAQFKRNHDNSKSRYVLSATVVLIHWASFNTCHVFAMSCLSLGSTATPWYISQLKMTGESFETSLVLCFFLILEGRTYAEHIFELIGRIQSGSFDDVKGIHENLCTVVSDTVSAYSAWFVLHWFTYGAGMALNIILISKEFMTDNISQMTLKTSLCLILVGVLYLFTLPCYYAARITSKCKGVYERINRTSSEDWNEGHPFRDHHNLALFVSYAKDTSCGFKIGRITFNTSLAWLSFFFGLTALLFHFF